MIVLACLCCAFSWTHSAVVPIGGDFGFGLQSANSWLPFGSVSAVVNVAVNVVVALLVVYINRTFNVLRSITYLVATMFLAMQTSMPMVLGQFYGGSLMSLLILLCTMLLFSVYADNMGQRRVYLIFLILGAATMTQVAYLFYVPMLLIGCVQMRVFSLRTCLAAFMGLVTPAWILLGFGIVNISDMQWPEMEVVWSMFDAADMVQAFVTVGFTVLMGIVFTVANILKILSYNSRVRAFNGFLTLLLMFTVIFMLLNFNNFTLYIPLLNVLVAYQVGHFFTYRRQRRSYLAILMLILAYGGLFAWSVSA